MIAIFSMVRKPFNFDTWLDYHFSIGVDYIFLRVEDTPELKEILDEYPNVIVDYINETDKKNNYWTLIDRQKYFFNHLKNKLFDLNIQWIMHIDSDELVCVNNLKSFFTEINTIYDTLHFDNYEVVCERDNMENPFLQSNKFRYKNLLAYGNGKSAARVNDKLEWNGPHRFKGNCLDISPKKLVILHFESSTFDMWYEKFSNISKNDDDFFNRIPFEFYKNSIRIINNGDIIKAKEYYNQMKVNVDDDVIKLYWTPQLEDKNINWVR